MVRRHLNHRWRVTALHSYDVSRPFAETQDRAKLYVYEAWGGCAKRVDEATGTDQSSSADIPNIGIWISTSHE